MKTSCHEGSITMNMTWPLAGNWNKYISLPAKHLFYQRNMESIVSQSDQQEKTWTLQTKYKYIMTNLKLTNK